MTVIVKTKMTDLPNSCKECEFWFQTYGLVVCPLLREWIEDWQWKEGMRKQEKCPLIVEKN